MITQAGHALQQDPYWRGVQLEFRSVSVYGHVGQKDSYWSLAKGNIF